MSLYQNHLTFSDDVEMLNLERQMMAKDREHQNKVMQELQNLAINFQKSRPVSALEIHSKERQKSRPTELQTPERHKQRRTKND
jgi:hypothetical protein